MTVAKGESGWPFAVPVTDDVAPGYSNEIRRPMDLGSVAASLKLGAYVTLGVHASLHCHGLRGALDVASQQTLCHRNMRTTYLAAIRLRLMPKCEAFSPGD